MRCGYHISADISVVVLQVLDYVLNVWGKFCYGLPPIYMYTVTHDTLRCPPYVL